MGFRGMDKRPVGRRIVALVAAYAVVLSSLLVSFGGARVAAAAIAGLDGIICHSVPAGSPSPLGDKDTGKIAIDCCSIGCLMLVAGLPPAPAKASGLPQTAGQRLEPLPTAVLGVGRALKSHRSRAPPPTA
jgi:hypothetical protein